MPECQAESVIPMSDKEIELALPYSQAHAVAISLQWFANGLTPCVSSQPYFWGKWWGLLSSSYYKAGDCQSQVEKCGSLQPLVKCPERWGKAEDVFSGFHSCDPYWLALHSSLIFCLTLQKFSYENLRDTGSKFLISGVRQLKTATWKLQASRSLAASYPFW